MASWQIIFLAAAERKASMSDRMAFFSRHVRLLYLLALFQLVGGPVVLCGVVMFARMGADKDVSFSEQLSRTIDQVQRIEQGDAGSASWDKIDGGPLPAKAPVPVPLKTKEGKVKLVGISEFFEGVRLSPSVVTLPLECWHDPTVIMRAQVPPLPPPRGV